jgi:hypothetical protein
MGLQDRDYMRQRHSKRRKRSEIVNVILIGAALLGAAALAVPLLANVPRNIACTRGGLVTVFYVGCDLVHPVNR